MAYTEEDLAAILAKPFYRNHPAIAAVLQGSPVLGRPLAAAAPEGKLQARLRQLALDTGHLYYHTHNSKRSDPGWPDAAILHREGGILYAWELKDATGTVTPAQRTWLEALGKVTRVDARVVRPGDWPLLLSVLTANATLYPRYPPLPCTTLL